MDPIFDDLNNEQADGNACIVCNADYTTTGIYSVPVGISATTRSQVFACEAMCAPAVGYRPAAREPDALHDELLGIKVAAGELGVKLDVIGEGIAQVRAELEASGDEEEADCSNACIAPEPHVHTSCPGPAAGAGAVSAR